MSDEQQPQHLVAETEEEKERRYELLKPLFIEGLACIDADFNQAEFSRTQKIPESTLSSWKKQQWFKDSYVKAIENNMVLFIKDLYVKAKEKALDGDFNFFKALLGQLEVLKVEKKEKQDTNITVNLVPSYGTTTTTVASTQQTSGDTPASSEIQGS